MVTALSSREVLACEPAKVPTPTPSGELAPRQQRYLCVITRPDIIWGEKESARGLLFSIFFFRILCEYPARTSAYQRSETTKCIVPGAHKAERITSTLVSRAFSWTSLLFERFWREFWIPFKFHKPVSKTFRPKNDIFCLLITYSFPF